MFERIVANTCYLLEKLVSDVGYCSKDKLDSSEELMLDAYISTSRQSHVKCPRSSWGTVVRDLVVQVRFDHEIRY
jgi:hypothetical protein